MDLKGAFIIPPSQVRIFPAEQDTINQCRRYSYGVQVVELQPQHIAALAEGKMVAFRDGDYWFFMVKK